MFPDFVKVKLKYPVGYNTPKEGPIPEPEDVIPYIHGEHWINLIVEAGKENLEGNACS